MQPTVDLTILVPVYNEVESLPLLLERIYAALGEEELCGVFGHPFRFEVLMVDDGSTDGSGRVIREQMKLRKEIRLVSFRTNFGKTAALAAGFREAAGEIVVTMDGDLQDDPFAVKDLVRKLNEGYDLVSGWKQDRRDPLSKTLPSRLFNATTRLCTGIDLHDFNCGLKAYRREVVESLDLQGEMHRYIPVLARWNGFRVAEVQVVHHRRRYGRTKFGVSRVFPGLFDFLTVLFITRYLRQPMHFFGMLSLVSFLAGFGISLYVTVGKLLFDQAVGNRPILFLGILLIIVAVQLFSIGLLGELVMRDRSKGQSYEVENGEEGGGK
ncbi:glycosyltransferase family 2 protein [Prosthecochloris sp. N3]|uniref:Glycosyltransferase family 2 protein n=1 Tax=Prosthecochloris ethylica TaxID=2743976 RepID=A0ABR9XUH4_9CHLB|nr:MULTISPECIES: glycosyltransferase family 2 protein [Prosthecochloris]MBF0587378.1 glycosyltransferase family 2 protein [Prosthecochloris ethylica]MBF0637671.1 glycosyltransferase family 2 protein [Prosthecochloris ethylica]NUK48271.1 glycosyltransferase family 2 protein [Prosthecochloris ethylica]RNA64513.1 glycosyltransferase [Prosthecochloris sp. ZM_2]